MGLSIAYHLARAGETDVVVLERNQQPFSETTTQAAGLVGQIRSTSLIRRAIRYAFSNAVRHNGTSSVGDVVRGNLGPASAVLASENMPQFLTMCENAHSMFTPYCIG
jgi:flavin-dependent dehydrogenase